MVERSPSPADDRRTDGRTDASVLLIAEWRRCDQRSTLHLMNIALPVASLTCWSQQQNRPVGVTLWRLPLLRELRRCGTTLRRRWSGWLREWWRCSRLVRYLTTLRWLEWVWWRMSTSGERKSNKAWPRSTKLLALRMHCWVEDRSPVHGSASLIGPGRTLVVTLDVVLTLPHDPADNIKPASNLRALGRGHHRQRKSFRIFLKVSGVIPYNIANIPCEFP